MTDMAGRMAEGPAIKRDYVQLGRFVGDCISLAVALIFALSVHIFFGFGIIRDPALQRAVVVAVIVFLILIFSFFTFWGHYRQRRPFWVEASHIAVASACFWIPIGFFGKFLGNLPLSDWFPVSPFLTAFCLIFGRSMVHYVLARKGMWEMPVIMVGPPQTCRDLAEVIERDRYLAFRVQNILDAAPLNENLDQSIKAEKIAWEDRAFHTEQFVSTLCQTNGVNGVILVQDEDNFSGRVGAAHDLLEGATNIWAAAPVRSPFMHGYDGHLLMGHDFTVRPVPSGLVRSVRQGIKRITDLIVASIAMLAVSPLFLVLMVLIRRDGGPAIFSHTRYGALGKTFPCYKFRTMIVDADKVLEAHLASHPDAKAEWELDHKLRDDPRITRVGRFLRASSLDELPQLLNVLKGEMSIVGPRPIVQEEIAKYGEHYAAYTQVRPGITGLWQVSGRNNVDYQTRVELDAWYGMHWSLWLDVVIALKTPKAVLFSDGAY